jgi:ABC-type thiamine transport system ATPase subunit
MAIKLTKAARAVPLARLVVAAKVVLLARQHWHRLEPAERRRLITLVRQAHGRRRNLRVQERDEMAQLIAKADPRLFATLVAQRFSPVPVPTWLVRDRRA